MSFQTSMPDIISSEESEALARFVHDLETRMEQVANLLKERGIPNTAMLARSITQDLQCLQDLLNGAAAQLAADPAPSYLSTAQ